MYYATPRVSVMVEGLEKASGIHILSENSFHIAEESSFPR